jgi:hypothetical protein
MIAHFISKRIKAVYGPAGLLRVGSELNGSRFRFDQGCIFAYSVLMTKKILVFALVGIFASVALVSLYMPQLIEWYFDPPMSMGISCRDSIAWALKRFQWAQLISIGVGALMGAWIGWRFNRSKPDPTFPTKN